MSNFTFSSATINVLKNFASINTNFLFRKGNTLRTISDAKNVFGKAAITETIPKEFAVYDLNQFLSLLSVSENPKLTFGERSVKIELEGNGKFEFFYAEQKIITAPPDKDITVSEDYEFALGLNDVAMVVKAAGLTQAPHLKLHTRDGKVLLSLCDNKDQSANSYEREIGETQDEFSVFFDVANLKLLPDAYKLVLSKQKVIKFIGETKGVEYFFALDPQSEI